jgi:hypothetical protein
VVELASPCATWALGIQPVGYDTIGQGLSGLLGILTDLDAPGAMGVSVSDHITGVVANYGVLAAFAAPWSLATSSSEGV